jgi:peroxiredoxin (alkyl hydroperoxide reductase subunit C)
MSVRVRQPAPAFRGRAVVKGLMCEIAPSDFRGRWLVLSFDPLDFAFACPTELVAFRDRAGEFAALRAVVVAASVDSAYQPLRWWQLPLEASDGGCDTPIVADLGKEAARAYGVLSEAAGSVLRGLFVIDPGGIVRHVTIDALPIHRSVDEVLRALGAARRGAEEPPPEPARTLRAAS